EIWTLPVVEVCDLLPQSGGPRVRRRRVDRLAVVAGVLAVARDDDLPGRLRELLHVREVVVVPVDRDPRLAGRDRLLGSLCRDEVAGRPGLREPVDARADVCERATVRERCG